LTFYKKKILYFCGYWKTILFRQLRVTQILVDHETCCVGNIISLSFMHINIVQIGGRTYPVRYFEGNVILNSELKTNMKNK
jgi:hypothetical protein